MTNVISINLIIAAAVLALLAIFIGLRIRRNIPEDYRDKWIFIIYLLIFLFWGCLISAAILIFNITVSFELVTAIIFLASAGYIYIVMKLIAKTILRIIEKEKDIQRYNDTMAVRNETLEKEISDRKKMEKALFESEYKYRNLIKTSPDMIFLLEKDTGKILDVNESVCDLLGYSRDEIIGTLSGDRIISSQRAAYRESLQELKRTGAYYGEFEVRKKDGTSIVAEVRGAALGDRLFAVGRDITERLRAEERIRSSEERLKILFEYIPEAIYLTDLKGTFHDINKASEELSGYSRAEAIGKNFQQLKLIDLKQVPRVLALLAESAMGKPTGPDELILNRKDSGRLNIEIMSYPVRIDNKKMVLGIARDITGHKKMEKALLESEEKYRLLVQNTETGFVVVDERGIVIEANEPYLNLVGAEQGQDIIGRSVIEWTAPECKEENAAAVVRCAEQGFMQDFETVYLRRDGTRINILINASMQEVSDGKRLTALCRNITERKRTEELIQLQLNRINVLHSIEKAVNSSLDLRNTLDRIVDQVTTQLGVDAATILLLNPHTRVLEYVVNKGFRSTALKYTHLKMGESNAGRAAVDQRIVFILNLMQDTDGFARSRFFASENFASYFAVPLIAKGNVKGVLELFHRSHMKAEPEWLEFLETIADQVSIAIDNAALFDDLQRSRNELMLAYDSTIVGWSHAMDMRDRETEGHSQRVTEITLRIAEEMGINDSELVHIKWGALLHDIGKIGVPDKILLKPDRLTDDEWEIMKNHTKYARDMLQGIDYLKSSVDIPYCHHEKWDGTGYPRGISGNEIPLSARIFAVADVWDALCSDRPYRPAWPVDKVIEHIRSLAGSHFDPEIVKVFLRMADSDTGIFQKSVREVGAPHDKNALA